MQKSQVPKGETGHWYSMDAIAGMKEGGKSRFSGRTATRMEQESGERMA
jgi:hypothetical protein